MILAQIEKLESENSAKKRNRKCDFSFRGVCVYPCNGGGDGTCTRVPTQDYLTFFVRSLFLSRNGRETNKPTVVRNKKDFKR